MSTDGINPLLKIAVAEGDYAASGNSEASGPAGTPPVNTVERPVADEEATTKLTWEQAEKVAEALTENTYLLNISLQFKVDREADRIVVSVLDRDTEEVIRQIPPEEVLELSKSLDHMVGLLFNTTA